MMQIYYIAAYFFEQLMSYMYLNGRYEKQLKTACIWLCFLASFAVQYGCHFFKKQSVCLIAFFVCNLLIAIFCFQVRLKNAVFDITMLASFLMSTELVVMYVSSLINETVLMMDFEKDAKLMLYQTVASKCIYFMVVFVFSRFRIKSKKIIWSKELPLLILPCITINQCWFYSEVISGYVHDNLVYILMLFASFAMLLVDVVVFFVHEKAVQSVIENAEYALMLQKAEIDNKQYSVLEKQYEARSMLIHDINRHLSVIRTLAVDKDCEGIVEYIDTVCDEKEISGFRIFSKNRVANVVLNHYYALCRENEIEFNCDIRDVDFSFLHQGDITSLLMNLLENAYESAHKSAIKQIDFSVENKNAFVIMTVVNSCDRKPTKKDDNYVTSKEDKFNHGYGSKIIKKISRRYNGSTTFEFNEEDKVFTATVVVRGES